MQMQQKIGQSNATLVKNLRHRDKSLSKLQRNCDIITAILQAASLKRRRCSDQLMKKRPLLSLPFPSLRDSREERSSALATHWMNSGRTHSPVRLRSPSSLLFTKIAQQISREVLLIILSVLSIGMVFPYFLNWEIHRVPRRRKTGRSSTSVDICARWSI